MAAHRLIETEEKSGVLIVRFLDRKIQEGTNLEEASRRLFAYIEVDKRPKLLLDLINVEIVSSSALSMFVDLVRSCQKTGTELKLCSVRPEIYEVLAITKLNKIFDIKDDLEDALPSF